MIIPLVSQLLRVSVFCAVNYLFIFLGRPTETAENEVFLCESMYEESRRQIKKLPRDGLKKYAHAPLVIKDEIYFFRRPIQPVKVSSLI